MTYTRETSGTIFVIILIGKKLSAIVSVRLPHNNFDDESVPLLISAHTAGTEGLRQPRHVLVLQAGDDNVLTVAVAATNRVTSCLVLLAESDLGATFLM